MSIKLAFQPNATEENLLIWKEVRHKDTAMAKLRLMDEALAAGRGKSRQILAEAAEAHGWLCPTKKKNRLPHEIGDRGWSLQSLETILSKLRKGAPWTVCVDGAKSPVVVERGWPAATIAYAKTLCEDHQRMRDGNAEAHREMLRQIRRGDSIPGLGTWVDMYRRDFPRLPLPASCPPKYTPRGMSYSNFKNYTPTTFEVTFARGGRSKSSSYRPLVMTSRRGCWVGSHYIFDDMDLDEKVIEGRDQLYRPKELDALDYFSGCQFAYAFLRAIENDAGVTESIKSKHMLFFTTHVLCNIGFSRRGTTLLVENKTAALPEHLDGLLDSWTDGTVKIHRSAVERAELIPGLFKPDPKGNPRAKAALESLHRLKHIMASALPGQTGRNWDDAPAEMYGRDQYTRQLQRALVDLSEQNPRIASALEHRLIFGHMSWQDFSTLTTMLYDRMNRREEHDLEGWDDNWITEFTPTPGVRGLSIDDLKRMPAEDVAGIQALIKLDQKRYTTRRKLSPWEVWDRGTSELVKLSWVHAPQILGPRNGTMRRLGIGGDKGGLAYQFSFEDRDLGPGQHVYLGELKTPAGNREMLRAGETYQTFIVPFDTSRMIVCKPPRKDDEVGPVLGIVMRRDVPSQCDAEGVGHAMGTTERIRRLLEGPVLARHAARAAEQLESRQANTAAITEAKQLARGGDVEVDPIPDAPVPVPAVEPANDYSRQIV